jgi:hypothetical protein
MISLSKNSKLKPEDVIKKAVSFWGPKGQGLTVQEQDACSVAFEGGGGGVNVSAAAAAKGSTVDVEAREWESQAKDFMALLK